MTDWSVIVNEVDFDAISRRRYLGHLQRLIDVVASEATQSILSSHGEMDCFVAFAPRNEEEERSSTQPS
jgi:hypothetical protein